VDSTREVLSSQTVLFGITRLKDGATNPRAALGACLALPVLLLVGNRVSDFATGEYCHEAAFGYPRDVGRGTC
jgi:hypothetical protein